MVLGRECTTVEPSIIVDDESARTYTGITGRPRQRPSGCDSDSDILVFNHHGINDTSDTRLRLPCYIAKRFSYRVFLLSNRVYWYFPRISLFLTLT